MRVFSRSDLGEQRQYEVSRDKAGITRRVAAKPAKPVRWLALARSTVALVALPACHSLAHATNTGKRIYIYLGN